MVKQIQELWGTLTTPDAVEQVFLAFFSFLTNLWGRDLSPQESLPFYQLLKMPFYFQESEWDSMPGHSSNEP